MRKLIPTIAIIIFNFSASSQVNKGAVFIGGNISYINNEYKNPTNSMTDNSFYVSPVIGFAVNENLVAGFLLTYSAGESTEVPAGYTTKSSDAGGGIFLRKYYRIKQSDFSVFMHGELKAVFGKSKFNSPTLSNESTSFQIPLSLSPGFNFRLSKTIHLEAGLNSFFSVFYRHTETEQGGLTFSNNTFGTGLNVFTSNEHLYFGIRFFLNN